MPIIKSARKRVKIAAKAGARNARTKRNLREALKAFSKAVDSGKTADITKASSAAMAALDTAAKKDVIHPNKAARKKAQLSAAAKAAGVKYGKTVAKKAPAKKAASKTATKKTSSK